MAGIKFLTSRLNRFKQQDIEEDPDSLSARAFRQRLLGDEVSSPVPPVPLPLAPSPTKVAVYRPPARRLLRAVTKVLLVVVAPLLALFLIGWLTFSIVSQNQTTAAPVQAESVFDGNIPIPANVRVIPRATNPLYDMRGLSRDIFKGFLPSYGNVTVTKVGSYISPHDPPPTVLSDTPTSSKFKSPAIQDLDNYYHSRLTAKGSPWQVYGTPGLVGSLYTTFYVRSVNGQQVLGGLLVQFQTVDATILRQSGDYYDKETKIGDIVILLSAAQLTH